MQAMAASSCTTTAQQVMDVRDGQVYAIKKLNDGVCWMTTNLRLGAITLTTNLTSSNTNLSTTITAATFNGYRRTSSTGSRATSQVIYNSGTDSVNGNPFGMLYNYCAVSAGAVCGSEDLYKNASYDICPKGWRLPTKTEFVNLTSNASYNTVSKLRAPLSSGGAAFSLDGITNWAGGDVSGSDEGVYYWASTNNGGAGQGMDDIQITTERFAIGNNTRGCGFPIRCVKK